MRSHATRHRACQGAALILTILAAAGGAYAAEVFHSDFSKGDFKALGWKAEGDWEAFDYNAEKNNPGSVARFPARKPEAVLTKTFDEVKEPKKLELSLDVGWGWGDAGQGRDDGVSPPRRQGQRLRVSRGPGQGQSGRTMGHGGEPQGA